ncbi:ERG2 and Sigma1 receptor like protein [Dictyocaulus viviparus]|uniref:Sigma non-opioid intracellular receptor 1 n=1 Tax=Dictyocaulus viviparus TaxID=29172 RepID=A0A0D8XK65_DICVI|nr:ERG2 and Sigma1 receptor like protein [Dictyocaulus viviparus]
MGFLFSKLIRNIVIAYVIFSGIQYILRWKSYVISPKEFRTIASKAQGVDNVASAVSRLTTDLRRTYGPAIAVDVPWVALSLGGLPLKALFLHASITEYVGVFGTPFPITGRIGMHWSNSTCTVLTGSVTRLSDLGHIPNKETFSAGGNFRHGQFESHIYTMGADTYVVCYGRGVIPISGLCAAVGAISHGEPLSLVRVIYTYGHEAFNQLSLTMMNIVNHYKSKATGKIEL